MQGCHRLAVVKVHAERITNTGQTLVESRPADVQTLGKFGLVARQPEVFPQDRHIGWCGVTFADKKGSELGLGELLHAWVVAQERNESAESHV